VHRVTALSCFVVAVSAEGFVLHVQRGMSKVVIGLGQAPAGMHVLVGSARCTQHRGRQQRAHRLVMPLSRGSQPRVGTRAPVRGLMSSASGAALGAQGSGAGWGIANGDGQRRCGWRGATCLRSRIHCLQVPGSRKSRSTANQVIGIGAVEVRRISACRTNRERIDL
jgi:hypothetical protein